MKMFNKIKQLFKPSPEVSSPPVAPPKVNKPRKKKEKVEPPKLSAKEVATAKGEPYISILKVDIDPNNINNGSFELDWNDKFVLNLIKQGYKIRADDTEAQIVDRWFQTVCRNIALEVYEQEAADPAKRDDIRVVRQRDLGDGFTEVS
jgi:hypothetical protein